MKRVTILLSMIFSLSFVLTLFAQIPNAGFENWQGNEPEGWLTNNLPGTVEPVSPSTDSHSGSFALRGEVKSFFTPYPPAISAGDSTHIGFPVSQRYAALTGFYKFSPVGTDAISIVIIMLSKGVEIGAGGALLQSADSYTAFNIPIVYPLPGVPDTCSITFSIIDSLQTQVAHVGSVMFLDDLSFSGVVAIDEPPKQAIPQTISLLQNYPNPFNPRTTIRFTLSRATKVHLEIFNVLGEKVTELVNQNMAAGTHSIQWEPDGTLPGGIYYYRLTAGKEVKVRKMVYLK